MEEGRPVEMKGGKRGINTSIYVEGQQLDDIEEIRWRDRKSKSEIFREAIDEYIRNHKEGNDAFKLDDWQTDPNFKAIPSLFGADEKWKLCFKNSNFEERTKLMIRLKYLRELLVFVDHNMEDPHNWKMDLPTKSHVPMLLGDKK